MDNDCNGIIDNIGMPGGCTPKITVVQSTQCGITLATIDQLVYGNAVSGSNGYRFKVTNLVTNQVQIVDKVLRVFRITELPTYAFNTTYKVEIAVKFNNVWQPFFGNPCTVTTPSPTSKVQTSQCGITVAALNTTIFADAVPFSVGYRFRITNTVNNQVYVLNKALRDFNFGLINSTYGTTYNVEVAVKNTTGEYSQYGTMCSISTPSLVTKIQTSQCGTSINDFSTVIYANNVPYATGYRFKIINTSDTSQQFIVDRVIREFRLDLFSGIQFSTVYSVTVAVRNTDGTYLPYGPICTITTSDQTSTKITNDTEVIDSNFNSSISPNPFNNEFSILLNTKTEELVLIAIYDLTGRLIENKSIISSELENLKLGATLPSGVYSVIITKGNVTKTNRIIKR